jgi:hypothetical protein
MLYDITFYKTHMHLRAINIILMVGDSSEPRLHGV